MANEVWQRFEIFAQDWAKKYGEEYFRTDWDLKFAKQLTGIDPDTQRSRQVIYFNDPWYENCKHSLSAFVKNFNKFVPAKKGEVVMFDCPTCGKKHRPHDKCFGDAITMPKEVGDALTFFSKKMSAG